MDEEKKDCNDCLAMVVNALAAIKEKKDSLDKELDEATDLRQVPDIHRQMKLLEAEKDKLLEEKGGLVRTLQRNVWKMKMTQWIRQPLRGIDYFEDQRSGGSSNLYNGFWPQDLKTWEDFGANVRAHVEELGKDNQYSRNTDDFRGLDRLVECTHSNIRQRFTEILKAFMRYEPFEACGAQLSVSKSGTSIQPSTEASVESTEANAALEPTQMARSASAESTEDLAIRRANEMTKLGSRSPDISVQNGKKKYFLVIECKRPFTLRRGLEAMSPDLTDPATQVLMETIEQVTMYMVKKKVGHAVLTSEDLTYFFKIEGRSVFVSDGLVWNSRDIPWLGAIHYILNTAKDISNVYFSNYGTRGGSQEAGGKPRKKRVRKGGLTTENRTADACDVSANCHLHGVGLSLKEVNVVDLNLANYDYAHGSTGAVALGQICGRQVIIKIARINKGRGRILLHEVKVYHSLVHLWGQSIPELVDYGSTVNGSLVYLATEYIAGVPLNKAPISEEVASAARKALGAIHCLGVLHGDIHAGNILVVDKDVRIIDFGFANYSHDTSDQERELNELEKILQEQMTDE